MITSGEDGRKEAQADIVSYSSFPLAEGATDATPALPSREEMTLQAAVPATVPQGRVLAAEVSTAANTLTDIAAAGIAAAGISPADIASADVSATPIAGQTAAQIAALCWRFHKGGVQILLVTSRETRRWVLTKGWPMPGLAPEAAAAREAWEEAGVEGTVCTTAIGSYTYDKILQTGDPLPCAVAVYPLRVRFLKRRFPECKERRRKWFSAQDAARQVAEPGLTEVLEAVALAPSSLGAKTAKPKSDAPKPDGPKTGAAKPRRAKSGVPLSHVPKSGATGSGEKAGSKPIKAGKP